MPLRDLTADDIAGTILPESIVDRTPADTTFDDKSVFKAAMRKDFTPASLATFIEGKPGELTPNENDELLTGKYDYVDHMPDEYSGYEAEYAKYAISPRHAAWVTGNIKQQLEDNQVLAEGGVAGFLSTTFAAMASPEQWPTYFIPGAILLKSGVMTGSKATIVATETAVAAGGAALGELALHETQAVRTKGESAFAVAGSAVFAGLLTGALVNVKGVMRKGEQLMADLDAEQKVLTGDFAVDEIDPLSMGAARSKADIHEVHRVLVERAEDDLLKATEGGDPNLIAAAKERVDNLATMKAEKLSELKHPKLARAIGWASPAVRVAGSRVTSARELMMHLVDDSLIRNAHTVGGRFADSLESTMKVFEEGMGFKMMDALDGTYSTYKVKMKEAGEPAMNQELFSEQVSMAMRNGDKHENEFVAKTASLIRKEVADPIQARLDAQDMLDRKVVDYGVLTRDDLVEAGVEPSKIPSFFKEDGTPKANMKSIPAGARDWLVLQGKLKTEIRTPVGDESYLHRLWDFEAVKMDPVEFDKVVSKYFDEKSTETVFANTIGKVEARIEKLETELATLDAKVAKSKKKGAVVERTYVERRAELDALQAKRDKLRAKGDEEAAKAIKEPKRTDRQRAYDKRQQLNHERDVELANAKRKHDEGIVSAATINKTMAADVRRKIEGSSYKPRSGAGNATFMEGPLKGRTLAIPTNRVSAFVENDIEKVMHHYVKGVNAQLHFKERFDPAHPSSVRVGKTSQDAGQRAFDLKMEEVEAEYQALRMKAEEAGDSKLGSKINKEWEAMNRDLSAMRDIMFDKYKLPDNPSGFWHQARQRLKEFNMVTMLGMMTVSAFADVGNYIARRGMKSFSRDILRFATNFKALKLSAQMNRRAGITSDLFNSSRVEQLHMMGDQYTPISKRTTGGKIKRGWKNAQNMFTQATLMPLWNNVWKNTAATSIIDDVLIDIASFKAGKLSSKKIEQYARFGLDADDMAKISKEMNADRDMINGVWVPDIDNWKNKELAEHFQAIIRKEVDMTITTPGKGDLPLASRGELGKLVFQFKAFTMAANNRILLAGLDDMTANRIAGMVAMTTLGYVSYATRQTLKGKDFETDYDTFIREGLDRSGQLAILGELNAMASKLTSGSVDAYRLAGADKAPLTRYASRNVISTLIGVSGGRVQDFGQLMSALASGKYTESDIRALRRTWYMNNHFATHRGFTEIEKALGGSK